MLSLILNLFYPEPERPSGSLAFLSQKSTGLALFTRQGSELAAVFKARGNVTVCVCVFVRESDYTVPVGQTEHSC